MTRNRTVVVSLALIALALTACGPKATAEPTPVEVPAQAPTAVEVQPTETPAGPVILRVGSLNDIDCWNPYSCTGVWWWTHIIIEGLTDHGTRSTGCAGVPRLADSWELSDDGRTWTVHLHEGITFNDGTPVTAQTVKDFMDWFRASETLQAWYAESLYMESIEVIDDLTLKYTTTDPIINSPDYDWVWWYILPPHVWSQFDESEILTFDNYPPIGTGPYVLTEHVPGSYMIFDARPDYYRGKPPIDRFVYTIYTNADAIVNALLAGEIDLTTPLMPPETYDMLVTAPNITVEEKVPYAGTRHWLVFNMLEGGSKHPAVEDPAVREAIDYAIDKQHIVDVALLGHGVTCPTNWLCGPDVEGSLNPDLVITPFDLDRANQILEDAGYPDTDGDGVRETTDGTPLEFRLFYMTEFGTAFTISQLITEWLAQVGIKVSVEAQESGTWYSLVLETHDFDMAIDTEQQDIDAASIDFWLSCWSAESGTAALNFPGYCNPEVDELVYEYWFSPDPEARWEPMYQAQAILNQDRPFITLAGENSIQAYRNDRFEFPKDTCDVGFGMYDPLGLLNAVVK